MKTDDRFLEQRFGKANPFKVPDNYFEDFEARMSSALKQDGGRVAPKMAYVRPLWRVLAVAACVALAVFGVWMYFDGGTSQSYSARITGHSESADSSYSTVDYVADYTMMDNDDIYALVSNN